MARKPVRKPVKKVAKKAVKKTTAKKPAAKRVAPVPPGHPTVTPHLIVRDGANALAWYAKAFGAKLKERHVMPGGTAVMYARMIIGDTSVHIAEEMQDWPDCPKSPQSLGGSGVTLHIYVPDCDKWYNRAVGAGATPVMPMMDAFWGDRYGQVKDPYGHVWSIATHKADLSEKQIAAAAQEFFTKMCPPEGAPQG